jgi:hypothetical protein
MLEKFALFHTMARGPLRAHSTIRRIVVVLVVLTGRSTQAQGPASAGVTTVGKSWSIEINDERYYYLRLTSSEGMKRRIICEGSQRRRNRDQVFIGRIDVGRHVRSALVKHTAPVPDSAKDRPMRSPIVAG